jgi:hypothetical protein
VGLSTVPLALCQCQPAVCHCTESEPVAGEPGLVTAAPGRRRPGLPVRPPSLSLVRGVAGAKPHRTDLFGLDGPGGLAWDLDHDFW